MPLPPLYGHDPIRSRLGRAIQSLRLPQTLLLAGPKGVGKQRLALWVGQALLCEQPGGKGEPCGTCRSCRQALALGHPDLHWFVPVEITKKGADPDKQVDLVQEALGEEMQARREHPLYPPTSGMASHGIASVRLLARSLQLTPAMGRRKVFILGDAERLTPQKGNPESANALLKALEEPPLDTFFILTSADPGSLLPTILSRLVRVNVPRLPDSVMTEFAQVELKIEQGKKLEALVRAADGSIGRLVELTREGTTAGNEGQAVAFLDKAKSSSVERYARALSQTPFQARGGFTELLDGLLMQLRERARAGTDTHAVVAAIAQVLETRELAQGNINPQLLTAVLADELSTGSREL